MSLKDDPLVLLGWSCPYCGAPTQLVDEDMCRKVISLSNIILKYIKIDG